MLRSMIPASTDSQISTGDGQIGIGRETISGPESGWLDSIGSWFGEKGDQFNSMDEGSKYNLLAGIASIPENQRNATEQNVMNAVNARAVAFGGTSTGKRVAQPSITNMIRSGVLAEQKRGSDKERSKLYNNLMKAYTKQLEAKIA